MRKATVHERAPDYLQRLTMRLAAGLSHSPQEFRERHARYLVSAQNADGGWSGREGDSDLYYTGFALRGLACLGGLDEQPMARATEFLRTRLLEPASVVDFMSLLYAARLVQVAGGPDVLSEHGRNWADPVAAALEQFRKPDGGYAKATEGTAGSTYHTFLVVLCYQLIGRPLPDPARVVAFIQSRRRDDGGFVEVGPARRGGTNPTAAAIAVLQILNQLDANIIRTASHFLTQMQSDDGGLRANDRVPLADLLSTFTALLTIADLDAMSGVRTTSLQQFVQELEMPSGGYRAGLWDNVADVEYTFYGLGTVALLASHR